MALDAGGARMRERNRQSVSKTADVFIKAARRAQPESTSTESTVRVKTFETHDGKPCDCAEASKEMTLRVGDKVELEHICHDGRVDKVIAEVLSIDVPPPAVEHGTVRGPA